METSRRNFLLTGLALPAALDAANFGPAGAAGEIARSS